ncbi:MAG: Gfo/Idh/MocA family oxidoreductase [bacterium]
MPEAIGIGLIGSGNMGRAVAELVHNGHEYLAIRSVFDPDPSAILETRKLFGDQFRQADSESELLQQEDIDWVMIASWNKFHAAQVIAAFEAGKHVFCQKPLATNLEDCISIRDAWRKSGKEFVIGFNLRYSPHYRRIKQLLSEGIIGDIVSFEFNETLDFNHGGFIMGDWRRRRENAGTHLLEKCCHDVDIANWMVGDRACRVASFGGLNFFLPQNEDALSRVGKTRSGRQGYMTWLDGSTLNPFTSDKNIVDNQVAIIEYENGVRASLHINCNTGLPERRMYICGTHGTLRADVLPGSIEVRRIGFGEQSQDYSTAESGLHGGGDSVLALELVETMAHSMTGRPNSAAFNSTTLEDGLTAAVTCFAIDEALDSGKVVDVESYWNKVDAD